MEEDGGDGAKGADEGEGVEGQQDGCGGVEELSEGEVSGDQQD